MCVISILSVVLTQDWGIEPMDACGMLIHKPSINPLYLKNLVSLKVQAPTIIFYRLDSLCTQYRNYLHAIAIYGKRSMCNCISIDYVHVSTTHLGVSAAPLPLFAQVTA